MNIHCIGIAGSGMFPLSLYLAHQGHTVTGSDRFLDSGVSSDTFSLLQARGITLFPQDGSGITGSTDEVIYSAAVEEDVPDRAKACSLGIPCLPRPKKLAHIFNTSRGIAVAGSSGKSTTSGMIAFLLHEAGYSPSLINGAAILNYADTEGGGAFLIGDSGLLCIEADESDGSLIHYMPEIGIVCNISRDHREIPELQSLFTEFACNCTKIIVNSSCARTAETPIPDMNDALSFGTDRDRSDFCITGLSGELMRISFNINECPFSIPVPGLYNAENAAAACAAASLHGLSLQDCADILSRFRGLERRMNIVGKAGDITVIDDFAHNPAKITAALRTARPFGGRLVVLYQPHGYGPTQFVKNELIQAFSDMLTPDDILFITDIFYAGGTAEKTVTAQDLVHETASEHASTFYVPRDSAASETASAAMPGDAVIIMGARDISLPALARDILEEIRKRQDKKYWTGSQD